MNQRWLVLLPCLALWCAPPVAAQRATATLRGTVLDASVWGDDPFPAVDSSWKQASRSFVATLTQTIGTHATNTFQFGYSGNEIAVTRGGDDPDVNARITSLIAPVHGLDDKQYGAATAHPLWPGGGGYPMLSNEAPVSNDMDLLVLKDDYTRVVGRHVVKAGALVSVNRKNEDTIGIGSLQHSLLWGPTGEILDAQVLRSSPAPRLSRSRSPARGRCRASRTP